MGIFRKKPPQGGQEGKEQTQEQGKGNGELNPFLPPLYIVPLEQEKVPPTVVLADWMTSFVKGSADTSNDNKTPLHHPKEELPWLRKLDAKEITSNANYTYSEKEELACFCKPAQATEFPSPAVPATHVPVDEVNLNADAKTSQPTTPIIPKEKSRTEGPRKRWFRAKTGQQEEQQPTSSNTTEIKGATVREDIADEMPRGCFCLPFIVEVEPAKKGPLSPSNKTKVKNPESPRTAPDEVKNAKNPGQQVTETLVSEPLEQDTSPEIPDWILNAMKSKEKEKEIHQQAPVQLNGAGALDWIDLIKAQTVVSNRGSIWINQPAAAHTSAGFEQQTYR